MVKNPKQQNPLPPKQMLDLPSLPVRFQLLPKNRALQKRKPTQQSHSSYRANPNKLVFPQTDKINHIKRRFPAGT
jgi:hypothetical protein